MTGISRFWPVIWQHPVFPYLNRTQFNRDLDFILEHTILNICSSYSTGKYYFQLKLATWFWFFFVCRANSRPGDGPTARVLPPPGPVHRRLHDHHPAHSGRGDRQVDAALPRPPVKNPVAPRERQHDRGVQQSSASDGPEESRPYSLSGSGDALLSTPQDEEQAGAVSADSCIRDGLH